MYSDGSANRPSSGISRAWSGSYVSCRDISSDDISWLRRTVKPRGGASARAGTIRRDDRHTPVGPRRRWPSRPTAAGCPRSRRCAPGVPTVDELFDFMRDAELRFATLRMRILETRAHGARRGRHPDRRHAPPSGAREGHDEPAGRGRRWPATRSGSRDGDIVRTYAAAHKLGTQRPIRNRPRGLDDPDFPGMARVYEPVTAAADGDPARHVRPPGRLLPERAGDRPVHDRRPGAGRRSGRDPRCAATTRGRSRSPATGPTTGSTSRSTARPGVILRLIGDDRRRRSPATPRSSISRRTRRCRRPPSTSSSRPGRRCSTEAAGAVSLTRRPSSRGPGAYSPRAGPSPARDGGHPGRAEHARKGGPATDPRVATSDATAPSRPVPAFPRHHPRIPRAAHRPVAAARSIDPAIPGRSAGRPPPPRVGGSALVREVSMTQARHATTSSSRTSPTCTSSATRRSCSARWAGSATSRSASASSAS